MLNKSKNNIYNESSIKVLEGLEAVRKRPGMYIGSTDVYGLHHLVWEIVDNSIDEALNGFCNNIIVTINLDKSINVEDNGRGIPIGMYDSKKSIPEIIYTVLHAGGKFDNNSYKVSGGLHGVGASVVNALSDWMIVTIFRDKKIHEIKFKNGGNIEQNLKLIGNTYKTGTKVKFLPNFNNFFINCDWNFNLFEQHLRESAFLINNLNIKLIDKRVNLEKIFNYKNGLIAFIQYLNNNKIKISSIINIKDEDQIKKIKIEIAFQYVENYNETLLGFANNVKTNDGGSHLIGFKSGLTKAINEYARKKEFLKIKDKNLDGNDIREGLVAIVSLHIPENLIQYEGQTKCKLGTPEVKNIVENIVNKRVLFWLYENNDDANKIINKVIKTRDIRNNLRKKKELLRNKNKYIQKNLLGKLIPAQSKNKNINELFLVEGDSAGGSAKSGRDRKFQAILPLKGKVINAEKTKLINLFNNEEIIMIINAIGAGIGNEFNIENCNYNKIIIMTDADTDGAHIQILLLTFFYRYMRDLITSGNIYIALPPLFKISFKEGKKTNNLYIWNYLELKYKIKEIKGKYDLQRYKGLGEMNAEQLWETTMNPNFRKLIKINIKDYLLAENEIQILMGDKPEKRRKWIEENIYFENSDY